MANLNIGVTIGGAVSETFNNAMRNVTRDVNVLRNSTERSGRQMGDAFRSTDRSLNNISRSARTAGASIGAMSNAHQRATNAARQHLSVLERMGNALRGMRNINLESFLRGTTNVAGAIGGAVAGGVAVNNIFNKPKSEAAQYEQIVVRMMKKDNLYGKEDYAKIDNQIKQIAKDVGVSYLQAGMMADVLAGQGNNYKDVLASLKAMLEFKIAGEAEATDAANITGNLINLGIKPEQIQEAYGIMAIGGKEGAFELKDMAREFPQILAQMKLQGYEGLDMVREAVIMAQVARKVTGNSTEAATLIVNGLEKINDTATTNRYNAMVKKDKDLQKAGFTDYKTDLMKKRMQGMDAFTAQLSLVRDIVKAKQGVDLTQLEDLKIKDPKKYEEVAKGAQKLADAFSIGEMFAELRAKGNLTAWLQNEAWANNLRNTINNSNGKEVIQKDLQAEKNTLAWSEEQKQAAATNQSIELGLSMGETTKNIDNTLTNIYNLLGDFWGTKTGQVIGQVAQPVVTTGGAVASGVLATGLLTGGVAGAANAIRGIGSAGASATNVLGRAVSSTAGRTLGAVGALGFGAYNAYETYQNRNNLTAEQEAGAYGSAAGGATGAILGGAIGSIVPVVGTIIGGIAGAYLGEWIGGNAGKTIGKNFGADKNDAKVQTLQVEAVKTPPAEAEPKIINNTDNSQHPTTIVTNVTVQGNADDPAKIANQIFPHIDQKLKEQQQRKQANSVFDNR